MSNEHKPESMAYRRLKYGFFNGGFLLALYHAIANGSQWAENISVFYCMAVSLLTLVVLHKDIHSASVEAVRGRGMPCPKWMNAAIDMTAIVAMASAGWYWCAALYLVHFLLLKSVSDAAEKPGPETAAGEA
ncbi:hypothetical protein [Methyloversatilis discipulorum]|uniref:hypothetical protein n=1 Tax=Methyloversatilis discipulorum TaxID=1119528 RepID=UPI000367E757|nr:hypothetical protein [Methyloversatilis discipulorum]